MNTQLLQKISRDVNGDKALWALYWANEYLDTEHPLRKAFATKAQMTVGSTDNKILDMGIAGKKASELSTQDFQALRGSAEQKATVRRKKQRVVLPRRRENSRRQPRASERRKNQRVFTAEESFSIQEFAHMH